MVRVALPALALMACAVAAPATAQNLVNNAGFETGDFRGWTQDGNLGYTSVSSGYAHTGTYGASLGPVGSNGTLSQMLSTTSGSFYDLSFWHFFPGGTPNYFEVQWNGAAIYGPLTNVTSPTQYTQTLVSGLRGTGADVLTFVFRNDPNYQGLDDVAVTQVAQQPGAVPEPATWAMMLLGFGMIGYGMRYGMRRSNAKFDLRVKRIAAGLEA